jgi:hypothetical protein
VVVGGAGGVVEMRSGAELYRTDADDYPALYFVV